MSEQSEQNAPERCSCCTCGYTWVKGQHGGHSCADQLLARIAELEAERDRFQRSAQVNWNEFSEALKQQSAVDERAGWTEKKPTEEGAYWIRGNGLEADALVQVKQEEGELWCNLHMRNSEPDFAYGYTIEQLSSEFEWLGPLQARAALSAPSHGEQVREIERLKAELQQAYKQVNSECQDWAREYEARRKAVEARELLAGLLREIAVGISKREMPTEQQLNEWFDRIETALITAPSAGSQKEQGE
jgi:hypothetical protein